MPSQEEQFKATPLSNIAGIATQTLSKLAKLDLHNVYDLILNLPFRYEDRTYIHAFNDDVEESTPASFLLKIESEPRIKPKLTEYAVSDHEGTFGKIVFFRVPKFMLDRLNVGTVVLAYGTVRLDTFSPIPKPSLTHPELTFIDDGKITLPLQLSPIYHLTAGLSQARIRKLTTLGLQALVRHPLEELLPSSLNPYNLNLNEALLLAHNPPPRADHGLVVPEALPCFQRICFEELIAYKLSILELKARQKSKEAPSITFFEQKHQEFLKSLPFEPTNAQTRVFQEILADVQTKDAMSRLVHGDVGSGKTLVAAMVLLQFALNGLQAAMLAPTDLLAKQHHRKISELFAPLNIEVGLVLGSLKKKERDLVAKAALSGEIKIFVGTHALFAQNFNYQNLALTIIDEQHRFGVAQREALLQKAPANLSAHELLMTATPIPRSLQHALFSDADVSTIDTLPQGRSPITTAVIPQERYQQVVERLKAHCSEGNQAYWVCPLVEDNEVLDAGSAKKRYEDLCNQLAEFKIGLLHAQMSEKSKNSIMEDFISGELQILVATTIVEVGVDVPNATVIVIESAERLGLAQLHQLRGRVGRGTKASFCILLYQPQNKHNEPNLRGIQRLEIMKSTTNGFEIANQDLLMRGPGEFFGTNQAGKENFRFADLNRDYDLIQNAQLAASHIFEREHHITKKLILRWFPDVLNQDLGSTSDNSNLE